MTNSAGCTNYNIKIMLLIRLHIISYIFYPHEASHLHLRDFSHPKGLELLYNKTKHDRKIKWMNKLANIYQWSFVLIKDILVFIETDPRAKYHCPHTECIAKVLKQVGKTDHCAITKVKCNANHLHGQDYLCTCNKKGISRSKLYQSIPGPPLTQW